MGLRVTGDEADGDTGNRMEETDVMSLSVCRLSLVTDVPDLRTHGP